MAQPTEFLRKLKTDENNARKLVDIKKDYILQKSTKGNKKYDPNYKPGNPLFDADEIEFSKLNDLAKKATLKFNNAKKEFDQSEKQKVAKDNVAKTRISQIEEGKTPGEIEADAETGKIVEDLNKEYTQDVTQSGRYIAELDDAGRKKLAANLNNVYGLKLPTNGKYSKELKEAYVRALTDNYTRSLDFNQKTSLSEFLVVAQNEGTYKGPGGGGLDLTPYVTISSPSIAKSTINQVFQNELKRDATPEEIKKLVPGLIAAQKKNPNKVEMVNGVRQTIQGLDSGQWIIDEIQKNPATKAEIDMRLKSAQSLTRQSLEKTARANGLDLNKNFGSIVDTWVKRVDNGENIEIFDNLIRNTAKIGLPDKVSALLDGGVDLETVYSPYKRLMASTLEVAQDSISLDDATLRMAIGPDKEMSLYDFQRSLRKDPRWQYTDQARQSVSEAALGVLRDFGFTG
jgi:hypothetical protein